MVAGLNGYPGLMSPSTAKFIIEHNGQLQITDEGKNKACEIADKQVERLKKKYVIIDDDNAKENIKKKLFEKWKVQYKQVKRVEEIQNGFFRRISHIARIPIFLLAGTLQLVKTSFKAIFLAIPTELYDLAKKNNNTGNVTGFCGVKKDLALIVAFAIETFGRLNPKKGVSFAYTCETITDMMIWEKKVGGRKASFSSMVSKMRSLLNNQVPSLQKQNNGQSLEEEVRQDIEPQTRLSFAEEARQTENKNLIKETKLLGDLLCSELLGELCSAKVQHTNTSHDSTI